MTLMSKEPFVRLIRKVQTSSRAQDEVADIRNVGMVAMSSTMATITCLLKWLATTFVGSC